MGGRLAPMTKLKPSSATKGREDHYVPQGYLRGFIHPQRVKLQQPLWVLDVERGTWSEKAPSQIGWERGFYDYSPSSNPDETADEAFQFLENNVPRIRDRIRNEGHASWVRDREVLVEFMVMMAVRSPLFREQVLAKELSQLHKGSNGNGAAKDSAIALMVREMRRTPHPWQELDWVLRYTKEAENPFVASDQVVGMTGSAPTLEESLQINDFWLYCPLSWDMCLIGSSRPLDADRSAPHELEYVLQLQTLMKQQARRFVASPSQIPRLTSS